MSWSGSFRQPRQEAADRMIRLRRLNVAEWPLWREMRLEALREAPYAFGSKLADWAGVRDTEERWRKRLAEVPLNVIAELDNRPAGMVGATFANPQREVELISMWVAPFALARRRRLSDWRSNRLGERATGNESSTRRYGR